MLTSRDNRNGPLVDTVCCPHLPAAIVLLQPLGPHTGVNSQAVSSRVVAVVLDELVAGGPSAQLAGKALLGKVGEPTRGVESQAVVSISPLRGYVGALLQQDDVQTGLRQARRRPKPARAGADDHRVMSLRRLAHVRARSKVDTSGKMLQATFRRRRS